MGAYRNWGTKHEHKDGHERRARIPCRCGPRGAARAALASSTRYLLGCARSPALSLHLGEAWGPDARTQEGHRLPLARAERWLADLIPSQSFRRWRNRY